MSLVNDMLRDLEVRNAVPEQSGSVLPSGLRKRQPLPWRLAVISFALASVIAIAGLYLWQRLSLDEEAVGSALAGDGLAEDSLAGEMPADQSSVVTSQPERPPESKILEPQNVPTAVSVQDKPATMVPTAQPALEPKAVEASAVAQESENSSTAIATEPAPTEVQTTKLDAAQDKPVQDEAVLDTLAPDTRAPDTSAPDTTAPSAIAQNKQPEADESVTVTPTLASLDQRTLASAQRAMAKGDYRQAEAVLTEFLQEQASNGNWPVQSRRLLAQVYIDTGAADKAQALLVNGLPAEQGAYLEAQLLQLQGDFDSALARLESNYSAALEQDETYRALMASLYQRTNRSPEAEAHYRRLLETFGAKAHYWLGLALALDRQEEFSSAITAYRQALQARDLSAEVQRFIQTRLQQLNGNF